MTNFQTPTPLPDPGAGMETLGTSLAAQARAQVEARYAMALRKPRNWDAVRQALLKECARSTFANDKSVWYRKPVGNGIEGLGIRFVETAFRCMTNIYAETLMLFEDAGKEVHRVCVTELEENLSYSQDVVVTKTVERSFPGPDGFFISKRQNSSRKWVYTVPASDDDMLNKRGALLSKAIRSQGLRLIPGDLQTEAEETILKTRAAAIKADPDGARKKIVDEFFKIGIDAPMLTAYLSHPISQCSPQEIQELRDIHQVMKSGETTWELLLDYKQSLSQTASSPPAAPQAEPSQELPDEAPTATPQAPQASTQAPQATPQAPQASTLQSSGLQEIDNATFKQIAIKPLKAIAAGKQSAEGALAMLKTKYLLSDYQVSKFSTWASQVDGKQNANN